MNVLPPLCTILCHLWLQIQLLHVVFNTFKPCLSWSSFATFSFHLNISAGTYPLPHTTRPTCPNQRNLPLLTTSTTHSIPKREREYSLLFLSDNFNPHILLTIHVSLRSSLLASSSFKGQVLLPHTKTVHRPCKFFLLISEKYPFLLETAFVH